MPGIHTRVQGLFNPLHSIRRMGCQHLALLGLQYTKFELLALLGSLGTAR
jgi:hypothetical protein